ncbi:DUF2807 domain-containing protein [Oceanispirochaeta sp.]|jgi:hypothetical protein|uniref:GIN domain-containing protein n=1 Tax=Oceanispirochaeta sp. TaxID=2035350 RepID=UPI00263661BD|nr:DUF2807 domain-containing protein [Oceanispirochaeta sp.]MDA3958864.1 DUF2807 domain-containing protein [Oceanispirochaeta sp.]
MKSSTKVLGSVLLAILLILCVTIVGSRIYLNLKIGNEYIKEGALIMEDPETLSYPMKTFNSLDFSGAWEIKITEGSEYAIKVTGPANLLDKVEISQTGKKLIIKNLNRQNLLKDTFKISLILPDLEALYIAGGVDMSFDGFSGESLLINLAGAGRIRGFDSSYENLTLNCTGAGQLDLTDCLSTNAKVNLSGAGEVLLNMGGGILSGSISGLGSVEYQGSLRENQIQVSGLGNVNSR